MEKRGKVPHVGQQKTYKRYLTRRAGEGVTEKQTKGKREVWSK